MGSDTGNTAEPVKSCEAGMSHNGRNWHLLYYRPANSYNNRKHNYIASLNQVI